MKGGWSRRQQPKQNGREEQGRLVGREFGRLLGARANPGTGRSLAESPSDKAKVKPTTTY
jgi:hypothetical protein